MVCVLWLIVCRSCRNASQQSYENKTQLNHECCFLVCITINSLCAEHNTFSSPQLDRGLSFAHWLASLRYHRMTTIASTHFTRWYTCSMWADVWGRSRRSLRLSDDMPADSCLSQDPSEANTHTRVFLYERRCYGVVYLGYRVHTGTLALSYKSCI